MPIPTQNWWGMMFCHIWSSVNPCDMNLIVKIFESDCFDDREWDENIFIDLKKSRHSSTVLIFTIFLFSFFFPSPIPAVDISNNTLYISSHIHIVYTISLFDHAMIKWNGGTPTGCSSFSWSLYIEPQPFIRALFVYSSLFCRHRTQPFILTFTWVENTDRQTQKKRRKADAVCTLVVSLSTITFGKHLRR